MSEPAVVTSLEQLQLTGTVLSIGNFDGVHAGHRALLSRMQELAAELSRPAVAVSFFPTSRMVFGNSGFLSSAREKTVLLSDFGPAAIVLIPFSREYAATDKQVFLKQIKALEPAAMTVGVDFRFGRDRQGSLNDLSLVTDKLEVFGLVKDGDAVISSSAIRDLLQGGDVGAANRLLGAPYLTIGEVVPGDRRGRTIGYPTANLKVDAGKVLPPGVFAVTAEVAGNRLPGMASAGARPMFPDGSPALEVHIFDYDGDLYGKQLEVRFISRLRDQQLFASLAELTAALEEDERTARRVLRQAGSLG